MAEGEFALVKDSLDEASRKPLSARGIWVNDNELYFMLADLALLQRDIAVLREYAPLAAETAERDGHILYQASACRALGVMHRLAGEYTQARTQLERALELFQGLETRWQIGRTLSELAELAVSQADLPQAWDYYVQALTSFKDIEAIPDVQRTEAALASLEE